jgi:DNA-binding NarL/FixJ family response regulator
LRIFLLLELAPILIVEDEPLIALELKAAVEDAGGKVVGPVGSVKGALDLLTADAVVAAILDVELSDGNVVPVATALVQLGIPIVVQSGVDLPADLRRECPDLVHYQKPVSSRLLIEKLAQLLKR